MSSSQEKQVCLTFRDMNTLNLQSDQDELVKAIDGVKKPYMVYLMHGRPLSINYIAEHAPAILDGWYAGEEAGNAFTVYYSAKPIPRESLQ